MDRVLVPVQREERDQALGILNTSLQQWRPVVMILVPGADQNVKNLPASGATPDDVITVAEDLLKFINENEAAESFREAAASDLGVKLENTKSEVSDATHALPAESAARETFSEAILSANDVLTKGLLIIRAIFGRTSPEYKQFIERASKEEEDSIDEESNTGEE